MTTPSARSPASALGALIDLDDLIVGAAILAADRQVVLQANSCLAAWLGRRGASLDGLCWDDLMVSVEPLFDQRRWEAMRRGEKVQFNFCSRLHQAQAVGAAEYLVKMIPLAASGSAQESCILAQILPSSIGSAQAPAFSEDEDLSAARRYVTSLLPNGLESIWGIDIHSRYLPSQRLGGDCFDYFWLNDRQLAIYLLDVAGHGTASALQSISLHNLIRSKSLSDELLRDPSGLLSALNLMFPIERQMSYFTMWYGIYDVVTRELMYSSGGHPPALLLRSATAGQPRTCDQLSARCLGIGLMESTNYYNMSTSIEPGDSLIVYSDGLFEFFDMNGCLWSFDSLVDFVSNQPEAAVDVYRLTDTLRGFSRLGQFEDDCSVVHVAFTAA